MNKQTTTECPPLYFDGANETNISKDKFVREKKTGALWFVVRGLKNHSYCQSGLIVKKFSNSSLWVSLTYLERSV
jgi:hypothetical protein